MPGRHFLNTEQSNRLDEVVRWYDRLGRRLQLPRADAGARPDVVVGVTPRRFKGLLVGAMSSTDPTHTVDNVVRIAGANPTTSAATAVTVSNVHGWNGDNNALARVEWVAGSTQWEFYQVNCAST